MDVHANCAELHKAVRSSFDAVFAKHLMLMKESGSAVSHLNHRKGMERFDFRTLPSYRLLKRAEDDLRDAQDRYRDALDACRNGTADKHPHHALPAEIIQYIISLAYDKETLGDNRDLFCRTGARSLAPTRTVYPRAHNFLLSSTTLQVDYSQIDVCERARATEHLEHTSPLKLQVTLPNFSLRGSACLPALLQHTSRMESLTLYHRSDFDCFIPALPYLEHLAFLYNNQSISSPNWTKINQVLQESGSPKLRSSILPSCFLARFTSSGLLRDVISLCIHFEFDWTVHDNQRPTLDQCLCTLSQLQKLTSLELIETGGGSMLYNASDDKCYGFTSLKRLWLTSYEWKDASYLVSRFSTCDLKEISFKDAYNHPDINVFACTLSDTFPRLERLQIATAEVRQLLRRAHGDGGNTWNFPLLHTLDFHKRSYSSEDLFGLIDVLRDRAGPEAHTLGVVPINCVFLDKPYYEHRELANYALMGVVPNLIWHS